ncbi:MAG TPA: ABC transporter substrate binding protein [Casimicrobiaceae bacterium]|nr:ABC transporter substrate binding protein [Casimicrobiaceae bacterium]
MDGVAGSLRIQVQSIPIKIPEEVNPALAQIMRLRPGALIVLPSQLVIPHIVRIADIAVTHCLPTISALKGFAERGLLLSYGADVRDLERQVAVYVDRIFKGAPPADLPVERPTKFELTVNMKTAKALQLTIPQSLLLRADERIE